MLHLKLAFNDWSLCEDLSQHQHQHHHHHHRHRHHHHRNHSRSLCQDISHAKWKTHQKEENFHQKVRNKQTYLVNSLQDIITTFPKTQPNSEGSPFLKTSRTLQTARWNFSAFVNLKDDQFYNNTGQKIFPLHQTFSQLLFVLCVIANAVPTLIWYGSQNMRFLHVVLWSSLTCSRV